MEYPREEVRLELKVNYLSLGGLPRALLLIAPPLEFGIDWSTRCRTT